MSLEIARLVVADDDFQAIVERHERQRLRALIVERLEAADLVALAAICDVLSIDPVLEWSLSPAFLRLLSVDRLQQIADELSIDVSEATSGAEMRAILSWSDPIQTPRFILSLHNLDLEPAEV